MKSERVDHSRRKYWRNDANKVTKLSQENIGVNLLNPRLGMDFLAIAQKHDPKN